MIFSQIQQAPGPDLRKVGKSLNVLLSYFSLRRVAQHNPLERVLQEKRKFRPRSGPTELILIEKNVRHSDSVSERIFEKVSF